MHPPSSGKRPSGCRVVSKAKTIEASTARDAPENIAAMPTSAASRGSTPAAGSVATAATPSSPPSPPPIVKRGASVPPDVPLPSDTDHDTIFHRQSDAIAAVLDALDVDRVRAYVGCSYGASVGLHFAARHASRLDQLIAIAGAHRPEAWALAQRKIQRGIVELGCNEQARVEALSLARQLAMIGYRTREELAERFPQGPRLDNKGLQHDCADWLNHVGAQYAARTPVTAWLRLSESLDLHRVDPAAISTPTTVMAVDEDQLVPPSLIDELVNGLPLPCRLHRLHSRYGHDAFLKETTAFDALLRSELEVAA